MCGTKGIRFRNAAGICDMKNQPHCADPTGSRHDGLDRCLVFRITKSAFEFCALPRSPVQASTAVTDLTDHDRF